jgi:hypothetical protein
MPETPPSRPSDAWENRDVADDFPLDVELRELYLRLKLDGSIWAREQPEDTERLAAYARALAGSAPTVPAAAAAPVGANIARPALERRDLPTPGRRVSRFEYVMTIVAAALVVALFSYTLLHLSPLALGPDPFGQGGVTTAVTATPTVTSTPVPTATRSPTPRAMATWRPIGPFTPYFVVQFNGKTLSENLLRNGDATRCSPDAINFQADAGFTGSKPGTFTFEWRFYDRGKPVSNPDVFYSPTPGDYTFPPPSALPDVVGLQATWYLTASGYSSTPRWGAQAVITAVNGKVLTRPIVSDIIALPTPAC